MEKMIFIIHQHLMFINEKASEIYQQLKLKYKCQLIQAQGNYIKIKNSYAYQNYPIPVIEVRNIGDIGFNLDQIFFEFSMRKDQVTLTKLQYLYNAFKHFEIYGGTDCMKDFYSPGESVEVVISKIANSEESIIMIAVYLDYDVANIVELFFTVKKALCI